MQLIATCPKCFRVSVPKASLMENIWEFVWICPGCKREYSAAVNLLKETDSEQVKPIIETYDAEGNRVPWPIKKVEPPDVVTCMICDPPRRFKSIDEATQHKKEVHQIWKG